MQRYNEIVYIHQVLLVDGFKVPPQLPEQIASNIEAVKKMYPSAHHKIWSGEELRAFLVEKFDKQVLNSFDTLTPYSYKTDIARFCLLYALGGLYLDLAVRVENPWRIPAYCGVAAFQEIYTGVRNWTCTQTSMLWAKPFRREFEIAINLILDNCRTRYYGPHDHYPTAGPLLGHAVAAAMAERGQSHDADDQWIGQIRYVTPERQFQNVCYIAPDKAFVGRRTKRNAGDLKELGLNNTNNYTEFWKSRQVYGEITREWLASDDKIVIQNGAIKTADGIFVKRGTDARVSYGPFVKLEAGQYCLALKMATTVRSVNLTIDLCENYGGKVLHEIELRAYLEEGQQLAQLNFRLDRPVDDFEFRVYCRGDFEGVIESFILFQDSIQCWNFDDRAIYVLGVERTNAGILVPLGTVGRVTYGPYTPMRAGRYCLEIGFSPETTFDRLRIEVCWNNGNEYVATYDHESSAGDRAVKNSSVKFTFDLMWRIADAEFRIEVFGDFAGAIRRFKLTPSDVQRMGARNPEKLILRETSPLR